MDKRHLIWIIPICLMIGASLYCIGDILLMEDYELYTCIYNNADDNDFPKNPYLIRKIQDECICMFQHNFTNIFENC